MSTRYVMVVDQRRCIGCHTCAIACKSENNMPNGAEKSLNIVITENSEYTDMPTGGALTTTCDLTGFNRNAPDAIRLDYLTRSCQHCVDAPCVKVCPVNATWQDENGIVDMDTRLCINCQSCVNACPYNGMRVSMGMNVEYTEGTDFISGSQYIYPTNSMSVKKCTFCAHRLNNKDFELDERKPFCIDHCPARARYFGDINDPSSEVSQILAKARLQGRTIRDKGVFPAKPGFSKPDPSVIFIAHDLV